MKITDIQDLIGFIAKSGLNEVNIETETFKLHIKRKAPVTSQLISSTQLTPSFAPPLTSEALSFTPISSDATRETNYVTIRSPMIGTFYRTPNPDAAPFVQEGDRIEKGTKLCIIEAMKLYNEIESEVAGRVVKILAEDISPVEYDQPLFLVDPS